MVGVIAFLLLLPVGGGVAFDIPALVCGGLVVQGIEGGLATLALPFIFWSLIGTASSDPKMLSTCLRSSLASFAS